MNAALGLALALMAGGVIGAIFFGGLWWTVRKGVSSKHPVIWFVSSILLRTSIALVGFYLIAQGNWQRLLVCFFGFVIARTIVTRLTRTTGIPTFTPEVTSDAP